MESIRERRSTRHHPVEVRSRRDALPPSAPRPRPPATGAAATWVLILASDAEKSVYARGFYDLALPIVDGLPRCRPADPFHLKYFRRFSVYTTRWTKRSE